MMGVLEVAANLKGEILSESTQRLWSIVFVILSIIWAYNDSTTKKFHKPFDFSFIAYILWPVVFPWYLISTRGIEGVVIFLGFLLLWSGPWFAGLVVYAYTP